MYVLHSENGKKFVGMSVNMHRRIHQHAASGKLAGATSVTTRRIRPFSLRQAEQITINGYGGVRGGALTNVINATRGG